jgi:hypothetical protein
MNAPRFVALTAAAFLTLSIGGQASAAPETLGAESAPAVTAAPVEAAAPPAEIAAPAPTVSTPDARPVVQHARPNRTARRSKVAPRAYAIRPAPQRVYAPNQQPFTVASTAPTCSSITCLGGVLLLGVGF